MKTAEVTTLCCGWTAWVIVFERYRFEVKRVIIRGVNLNFISHFGFCELTELIFNTKSGLHSQFTKETQHKVKKSKIQRISANNKLYSKSLKPQVVERLGDKFLLSKQRVNKMDFFRYCWVRHVRGFVKWMTSFRKASSECHRDLSINYRVSCGVS